MPTPENTFDEKQNSSVLELSSNYLPGVPLIPIQASSVVEHSKESALVLPTEPVLQGKRAMNHQQVPEFYTSFSYAKRFQACTLKSDFNAG